MRPTVAEWKMMSDHTKHNRRTTSPHWIGWLPAQSVSGLGFALGSESVIDYPHSH